MTVQTLQSHYTFCTAFGNDIKINVCLDIKVTNYMYSIVIYCHFSFKAN